MRARLWLVAALIAPALHASELVYRPVNPSFGGNPLNSSHLLGTANAQNDYKDPASSSGSSGTSALDRLTSNLQSRLISQLLADIGKDGSQSGSLVTDDFAINVVDEDGTLVVSITDRVTNQTTMIEVNGLIAD
ncbi:curli production assembly protein CsgF [Aeromonas sobria]|uniref:Curli production assembly/transport component CsgF n=1 Tax=Aeromonas sobria TaxID=646 RepID=A0A2N3IPJ8_AERSO|nr:curli assembly protein CsgF [Aeromonas sobria]PKQ73187.1 curli production assembly protein CsgF [Aeromonas sobria]